MRKGDCSPLLSIIIPVFNRQDLLDNLLKELASSILDRGWIDLIEIVIVDDFSTPYINISNFPLEYLIDRNIANCGAPFSRKSGYEMSHGKFIHFHDSDDSIDSSWLSLLVECLENTPELDVLLTARNDIGRIGSNFRFQKYFDKQQCNLGKISKRLIYRNCMGPLGGVTFSRRVLENTEFKRFASCQDWQMYIDAMKHAKVLVSRPDIKFIFNKTGDDRISHNPRKKILGHLQLAKITGKKSIFGRHIRLFYLYTCKQHIYNKGGYVLRFYKKNRLSIFATFLIVSIYWRVT